MIQKVFVGCVTGGYRVPSDSLVISGPWHQELAVCRIPVHLLLQLQLLQAVVFATRITKENGHWGKSYYCCCCRHMHSSSHSGLNLYFTSQSWLTPLSCQCMEMFTTISWSAPASLFVNLVPPCSLTFQHHMVCHLSWVESAKYCLFLLNPSL
jgi:hypothetical protein